MTCTGNQDYCPSAICGVGACELLKPAPRRVPLSELELDGYEPGHGPRSPLALVDGEAIDREACEESNCPCCGRHGLEFHPFHKPGSYRGFAVCPQCGDTQEF